MTRPTMTQPTEAATGGERDRAAADCCGPASCWGWSPPPLPADTPAKRWVDRWQPRTGWPVIVYFGAVVALLNLATHVPTAPGLALDGLAALAAGGWCALNFWRCRHAHCLITGAGWLTLSLFSVAEAALGRSVISGTEGLVFLGVLATGLVFEAVWYLARGSNAVASR